MHQILYMYNTEADKIHQMGMSKEDMMECC